MRYKFMTFMSAIILPLVAHAKGGAVDYSQGAEALALTFEFVTSMCIYMIYLVNTFGALVGLYGALQIYLKMMTGGGDITRSILFLIGGAIFLICGCVIMPAIFGYQLTS